MSNKGRGLGGKLTGFYVPELGILFASKILFHLLSLYKFLCQVPASAKSIASAK